MGMYHSTSGKLGFTAHAVPLRGTPGDIPLITRAQMKAILAAENRLRLGDDYQQRITDTNYVLSDLHAVTLRLQRDAIKEVLGSDVAVRLLAQAHASAESDGRKFDKFRHPIMDHLLTQLHNARYEYKDDPEMNAITVYQRFDRSRRGTLRKGDAAPNVDVIDLASGEARPLLSYLPQPQEEEAQACDGLVLVCGSVS